jgi:hypothetical protein
MTGAFGHVQSSLNEQARACFIHLPRQRDACRGDLIQLEVGVRVPVGRKPLQSLQLFVLRAPHRFTATRCGRRAKHQLRSEKAEHMRMLIALAQRQGHGGADQVGKAERGAYLASTMSQGVGTGVSLATGWSMVCADCMCVSSVRGGCCRLCICMHCPEPWIQAYAAQPVRSHKNGPFLAGYRGSASQQGTSMQDQAIHFIASRPT